MAGKSNISEKLTIRELISILENPTGSQEELQKVQECMRLVYAGSSPQSSIRIEGPDRLAPTLEINPETVDISENIKDIPITSKIVRDFFKSWRQRRYRIKTRVFKNSIKIVSEGDSWFQYPLLLDDIIDRIFQPKELFKKDNPYAVYSLGHAAAKLTEMIEENEFIEAIRDVKPAFFLLSGGGNDLMGGGNGIEELIVKFPEGTGQQPIEQYIVSDKLNEKLKLVMGLYQKIFNKVLDEPAFDGGKILCHGYDYVRPTTGGWILGKRLAERNITDENTMFLVVKYVINRFNDELISLISAQSPERKDKIIYVDCRGAAGASDWNWNNETFKELKDDFHPNNAGFEKIAKRFFKKLEEFS